LQEERERITKAKQQQRSFLSTSNALLHEAEANLSAALKKRDMDQIGISRALLEVANKRMTDVASELSKLSETGSACLSKLKRHSPCDIIDSVEENEWKKSKLNEPCNNKK
jgi:hypothetical protein